MEPLQHQQFTRVHLPYAAHLAQAVARKFPAKPEYGECVSAIENIRTKNSLLACAKTETKNANLSPELAQKHHGT